WPSNGRVAPTTIFESGRCGTWWRGTRAGSKVSAHARSSLRWSERATDEVLGPDRLCLTGLDVPDGVGHRLDASPQRNVELATQADRDRARLVETEAAKADGPEQLAERRGGEDRLMSQI